MAHSKRGGEIGTKAEMKRADAGREEEKEEEEKRERERVQRDVEIETLR